MPRNSWLSLSLTTLQFLPLSLSLPLFWNCKDKKKKNRKKKNTTNSLGKIRNGFYTWQMKSGRTINDWKILEQFSTPPMSDNVGWNDFLFTILPLFLYFQSFIYLARFGFVPFGSFRLLAVASLLIDPFFPHCLTTRNSYTIIIFII